MAIKMSQAQQNAHKYHRLEMARVALNRAYSDVVLAYQTADNYDVEYNKNETVLDALNDLERAIREAGNNLFQSMDSPD
jgi:succinate dehydrogenase/fumarate reductase-like Fe-S protein